MSDTDYYALLEVERTATDVEIKRSYRKLAMKYHPDKNPAGADMFKSISHAYEVLSDPDRRAAYDRYGSEGPPRGPAFNDFFDASDFEGMFGMDDGMHGGFFGGGHARAPQAERHHLDVSLEDLYRGKKLRMKLARSVPCKTCKGLGGKRSVLKECFQCSGKGFRIASQQVGPGLISQMQVKCTACKGTGKIIPETNRCRRCKGECVAEETDTVEVNIEPGARDSDHIVLKGKGDQKPGQDPLDLVFVLRQRKHGVFARHGSHLSARAEVDLAEALCGFSRVLLTHLDGRAIEVVHRAGVIRPGDVLCIAGEGMPRGKHGRGKGDLYIHVDIRFPERSWKPDVDALQALLPRSARETGALPEGASAKSVTSHTISAAEFDSRMRKEQPESRDNGFAHGGHEQSAPECRTQ
ncbi:DnaJ-like protein xdj1 [Coemansia sp. Benny D115]|nr:DnaJ-like protein xdj1 [Coemansia sp. Benny D115]